MKATIKKLFKNDGTHWFYIYAGNEMVKSLIYKPDAPEDSAYNEKKSFEEAMAIVKVIESADHFPIEETIYETPGQ